MQKILEVDEPSQQRKSLGWQKIRDSFQQQIKIVKVIKDEMEDFIFNMQKKTQKTFKQQKMRMIAKNIGSVYSIDEVKAKVEKLKYQIANNKFFQKTQEEIKVIQQDTQDNEIFNKKLKLFIQNLKEKKEKEDTYNEYLSGQIKDRKALYKKVNQRNIHMNQEIRIYTKHLSLFKASTSSVKNSLLNKSFDEHASTSNPQSSLNNQRQSLDILKLLQDTQTNSTTKPKISQKLSLSNITNDLGIMSNDGYKVQDSDIESIKEANAKMNGEHSEQSSNIFQQTNQFQYPEESYDKIHTKLVNVQFITKRNRIEFFQKLEQFFSFHETYKSCMEYFYKNYVKSYQVQQNNQVHKSLLYQLKKNKQNDHQQNLQEQKELYFQTGKKSQENLLSSTIQKDQILQNSFKMASIKIELQKEEQQIQQHQKSPYGKQKSLKQSQLSGSMVKSQVQLQNQQELPVEVEWNVFRELKANQLMAVLQLRKDALDSFNSSIEQKKRELHLCLRQIRLAQQNKLL